MHIQATPKQPLRIETPILWLTVIFCLLIPTGILILRLGYLEYDLADYMPDKAYQYSLNIDYRADAPPMEISTFLPMDDHRQVVINERLESAGLWTTHKRDSAGRSVTWIQQKDRQLEGSIRYQVTLRLEGLNYQLPDQFIIEESTKEIEHFLSEEPLIQINHPLVKNLHRQLTVHAHNDHEVLRNLFNYVQLIPAAQYKGLTDAVTTIRLNRASCNGKSRLLVALARRSGIPARLVGGLILTSGEKQTSHQWVELHLAGQWVPFDALNNHFAAIPENFLSLYRGDHFLFSRSTDMHFDFNFDIESLAIYPQNIKATFFEPGFIMRWYQRFNIDAFFLEVILMLPLGVLVVIFSRNVIGLKTFGTFLPALIAVAARDSGLIWGLTGFMLVIGVVAIAHYLLERWRILQGPKMGLLMLLVIGVLFSLSLLGQGLGLANLQQISLFPVAILTITAERLSHQLQEDGLKETGKILGMTLLVISGCFWIMNSPFLKSLFINLPELYLMLGAIYLLLGRWIGIRLMEAFRFKPIISKQNVPFSV